MNETLKGHIFHDGIIVRRATRNVDGSWTMKTTGVGNNETPGMSTVNELRGPGIFRSLDAQMRERIKKNSGDSPAIKGSNRDEAAVGINLGDRYPVGRERLRNS